MVFGLPAGELALLAGAILIAGLVSGLLAGLFGIGGTTVIIPVLYEVFRLLGVTEEFRMQLCIGTALAVTVPTMLRAYYAHRAKGAILNGALRVWAIPAAAGVAVGSYVAHIAPGAVFKTAFVLFALFMSTRFLLGRDDWRAGDQLPGTPGMAAAGFSFGFLATLVGIAGGSFSTLFLTLFGTPFHVAVATSSGLGLIIGVPATIGYMSAGWAYQSALPPFSIGFVSVLGALLITPTAVFAAPYGARLAHRLSKRKLEVAFGLFLLLIAIRFAASLLL
ncbi:MAG: sulfite exporter TauE/SafE family protein [Bradyrhizobiaceae bacterium]|nr:sulfite exporter TauE/SafE family protein [Bradyrhizobiaceae bacterium]